MRDKKKSSCHSYQLETKKKTYNRNKYTKHKAKKHLKQRIVNTLLITHIDAAQPPEVTKSLKFRYVALSCFILPTTW